MSQAILGNLVEIVKLLVYAICGAIIMGISLGVFLRILQRITPINEWEELKKGNIAVAIYFGMAVLALGLTIMTSILPTTRKISPDPLRIVITPGAPDQDEDVLKELKQESKPAPAPLKPKQ